MKYMQQLQRIANREQQMLVIDLEDIAEFEKTVQTWCTAYETTQRYVGLFSDVVDSDISEHDEVIDVILHQRRERNERLDGLQEGFPDHLLRRYNLYFQPLRSDVAMAVRDVKGVHLGKLITVRGIVTRVSEVKPLLLVNAYTCDVCGSETFQEISRKQFTPIIDCQNENECKKNGIHGSLHMQTRACRFSPFQEVKIQEMADQVPVGHIPRSMTIHVNGSLTRQMNPGDVVHLGGIFLPVPYTGYQAVRAGLLRHDPALYQKLAQSIAPEIYGHIDVKKALLLLLVGGATKNRGDLNVCLMGDPGVAKSQLLKYIAKVAPRGVYTTGKGSSGVGLTAAVMRDPVTDEMVLEGGALVLADNVMEQQTISISKAGISTTLNARTSILAAANPLYGRYNPKFDLLFLILDKPSRDEDERLAQHVTHVHMYNAPPELEFDTIDPVLIRHYIAGARQKRPTVPPEVSNYVVESYVRLRKQSKDEEQQNKSHSYTSARTLLGVLRLAQALARLRTATSRTRRRRRGVAAHGEGPKRRTKRARRIGKGPGGERDMDVDDSDEDEDEELSMVDIRARVLAAGFTEAQLMETIINYEDLDIWMRVANNSKLRFTNN
ncbi:hypothetical protein BC629DRAFT_1712319 [Irpex lacteus]|nr:hypothetical protein BC629DRAFT_1712319 [Irpex lacteus]